MKRNILMFLAALILPAVASGASGGDALRSSGGPEGADRVLNRLSSIRNGGNNNMAANEVSHSAEARGYLAYISYRHEGLDRKAAEMIQERINGYTIPKELRRKPGMKKLGTVFRDEEERLYSRVLPSLLRTERKRNHGLDCP